MAALLLLALGTEVAAPAPPRPVPSLATTPVATEAIAPARALAAETGDIYPTWVIDFSFWLCERVIEMYETLSDVLTEGLKEARQHGDAGRPARPAPVPEPVMPDPPLASPHSPSPRLAP